MQGRVPADRILSLVVVPLWLLRSNASHSAVRLYALLSVRSNGAGGDVPVDPSELQRDMRCSQATYYRSLAELERVGAVARPRKGSLVVRALPP